MKKFCYLFSAMMLLSVLGSSQNINKKQALDRGTSKLTIGEDRKVSKTKRQQKAPPSGATIFLSEDFSTGSPTSLPTGWSVTNLSAVTANRWIWSNSAPGGQYSLNVPALASTTANNGYMSLPCDLYNTPFPSGGPNAMDTYFESPSFAIGSNVGSVIVEYQHYMRYCCSTANELVLEVSSNGTTWSVPYNAVGGRGPNTFSPNGETVQINVSADLAFQSTGYIRFRSTGNSHYFWMIDDVYVFEGPDNQMELQDYAIDFHPFDSISPLYRQMPVLNMHPISYSTTSRNAGALAQTNTKARVEVYNDSTIGGGAGTGLVFTDSSTIGTATSPTIYTNSMGAFNTSNAGWYRNKMFLTSDSTYADPSAAEANYLFALTNDTVFALERGEDFFVGSSGPPSYVGGGQDNDAAAALFIIDTMAPPLFQVFSVSVYIPYRGEVHGLSISPRVWDANAVLNSSAGNNPSPIGSSPFSFVVDTALHGNSWVSLPIFPPLAIGRGSYYCGVEQTAGATNGKELWLGRDVTQEPLAPDFSNLFFLNEPGNARWIAPPRILGIRLNGDFYIGLDGKELSDDSWQIFPNPSNGEFSLRVRSEKAVSYQLKVRNNLGQIIHTESLNVKGEVNQQIDLSNFDKGVYFLSLEDGEERLVKKVVVQ